MKHIEKIKDMLCEELKEYSEQKSLSVSDLEMIDKLAHAIKNLDKIEEYEGGGYSEHYGYPMYADRDSSYARRGSHYVRGHYSRDDEKDYSRDDREYSGTKDKMMNKLGEMMNNADPAERRVLKETMRKLDEM